MRQLDRPDLRGFVPRQKPSEFRLVLKLTRPENHSLERRKAFLPGGWIFLSTRGRILISANAMAAVDRLVHHALILEFDGESQRVPRPKEKGGD